MEPKNSLTMIRLAGVSAVTFHGLGLLGALFGIRYGTAVFPVEHRMAYVATSLWGWKIAWGIWLIAALTFVWFLAVVDKYWSPSGVAARLSLMVGVAAATLDLLFDTVLIVVLPAVAARGPESHTFQAIAHFASAGGIIVANGLYAVAVALMTVALGPRQTSLQRWLGWSVLATGLLLTAAGFFEDPHLPEFFAGPAIGSYILWVAALAWRGPVAQNFTT